MKIIDIIFALVCGYIVAWLVNDFLKGYGINIGIIYTLLLQYALAVFSLFCLWLAYLIGKRLLFVFQAAKYLLVGIFATVVDLKFFEFSSWIFLMIMGAAANPLISKGISFIIATFTKYWGNKHWVFGKNENNQFNKEIIQFFIITAVGLGIDVGSFFYFTKILGPQFGAPIDVWLKLSVIFAAFVAATWNFLGYKFLVFKK